MSQQKYPKAYEAYQQAVYRDGRNPTFWCSIGVLYYQINQYRDALDAYSRAIRLNPYISEVWYDLGTLVSTCITTKERTALNCFFPVRVLQ
jgi:glucose repression mediator protein